MEMNKLHETMYRATIPKGEVFAVEETEVYDVIARHVEGTELCSVKLPCKYKDKELKIWVSVR